MAVYVHTKDHTGLSGSKKFGFTLAEVLIITVILGVIAFLTIPALVTNIQDMQTRTRLKKAYQILSAATILVVNENGGTLTGLPKIGWIGNSLISYYYKYLNVVLCLNSLEQKKELGMFCILIRDMKKMSRRILSNG